MKLDATSTISEDTIIGTYAAAFLWTGSLRESINRRGVYPKPRVLAHPKDCSVMTYRGHAVLRTLIRCYFSPTETTGGQYLYSGSYDGKIHVSITVVTGVAKPLMDDCGGATDLVSRRDDRPGVG